MAASFEDGTARAALAGNRGAGFPALAFREFFRNPLAVGSAFPASHYLVDAMLDPVDWSRMERVIEYGPGTGIFTRALLDRLPGHARLLAIDTSPAFIGHLRGEVRDRRLTAVTGSADAVLDIMAAQGWDRADGILSGLPFSTLAPERAERLMQASARALRPDGRFLAYQMRRAVKPLLERRFARVEAGFEWRNVPPCHLYWASGPVQLSSC
ncbi:class I SAM-dependent methyltransferase [Sphingobium chlorophenolicum]|uniref:class I SAM-dependent methyltransferase n=1 Tax=Sphingobium chlorophenolicum TaxID=46429 RepID=UPI0002EAE782|nr:methyltransferase domain-containing protein [Sphingobium chlorophenolicum]